MRRPLLWGLLAFALGPSLAWAVPSFTKEAGIRVSSAAVQAATGAYPALRLYYIRGSSQVYSATTDAGLDWTEEAGVRISSLTVPSLDIAVSSITGCSILPLTGGGFRMLYSVIGSTGAYRIYSATSADGLAWANDTGTRIAAADDTTFTGYPTMVKLGSGDWRVYYIQNSVAGDQISNHQIFSALSTNQGRNFASGSVVVSTQASQAAATLLSDNRVRLYYTAPASGESTHTVVASAVSSDALGSAFSLEAGVRVSTPSATGSLSFPFVVRSTNTFSWRLYYNFALPGVSTAAVYSAVAEVPNPQSVSPATVYKNLAARQFTITGEIFSAGPTAALTQTGQTDIAGAALTRVDDQTITVTFDTQGKNLGYWDLVVTNSNGRASTLSSAVNIDFQGGSVAVTDNLLRPRAGTTARIDATIFNSGHVTIKLYTLNGALVRTLYDGFMAEGTTTLNWDAKTSLGNTVASGLYLLQSTGPKLSVVSKIIVIK
ncbi:MAG: hypothetical protein HY921_11510 [Elusimicrobia bacterium]|nr:hypothetical protein [Elusimicrobiota bacterium]